MDDVAVIAPSPEMQRRILGVIDTPSYAALHNPSYPLRPQHQNCNSFVLHVVGAAEAAHVTPTVVETSGAMRLFGP